MTFLSYLCCGRLDSASRDNPHGDAEVNTDYVAALHNVNLYSYKELRIATNDFSPYNKIGEGGFGPVFKGKLRNGQTAALKLLSAHSNQGVKEFLTEIQVISDIDHENLVKLYGCCVEGSHRILVYHFLQNNSLTQTLLGRHSSVHVSWSTRVKICIGVAKGLAYLHEEVDPQIIHRDIKASNILLDDDLTPKISDFGLAKLITDNMTHVSTRVAGTIGYLAPEYAIRGQVTRRTDVYSFGVLLIEIVSGRSNTNMLLPVDDRFILERAWKLYRKNELVLLVDDSLDGKFDAEQACRFLKIGLLCAQDNPKLRPSMSKVVQMLTSNACVIDQQLTITRPGLVSDLMGLLKNQGNSSDDTTTMTTAVPSSQYTSTFTKSI